MVGAVLWVASLAFATFWTYKYVNEVIINVPRKDILLYNEKTTLAGLNKTNITENYQFRDSDEDLHTTSGAVTDGEGDEENITEDYYKGYPLRFVGLNISGSPNPFEKESAYDTTTELTDTTTDITVLHSKIDLYPKYKVLVLPKHIQPKYVDEITYTDTSETTTDLVVLYARRNLYPEHIFFKSPVRARHVYNVKSDDTDDTTDYDVEVVTTKRARRQKRQNNKYKLEKMFLTKFIRKDNSYDNVRPHESDVEDDDEEEESEPKNRR